MGNKAHSKQFIYYFKISYATITMKRKLPVLELLTKGLHITGYDGNWEKYLRA